MDGLLAKKQQALPRIEASQVTDFDTFMASPIATSWCQHLCFWQRYLMLQERGCGGTGVPGGVA